MRSAPPEVVAAWPAPNYVDPETRGPDLIVVGLVTLFSALLCLGLRLYVRLRIMRKIELDDWVMVAATICSTGATICIVLAFTRFGWKQHIWDLRLDTLVAGRKASFATQAFFVPATLLTKISILISYLRLAPQNSMFRRLSIVGPWVIALVTAVFWIILFAQCKPITSYWNLTTTARDCMEDTPVLYSHAISMLLFDFFVWVLPLPTIYRANLPLNRRLAIIALFSVALLVVVAAAVRIYYLDLVLRKTYDVTWEGTTLWLWTAVEVNLGIICGCVPWLKSLVKSWRRERAASGAAASGAGNGGSGSARNRPHSEGVQIVSSRGAVFRMDGLGKGSGAGREKGTYIDLESCDANSEPETRQG